MAKEQASRPLPQLNEPDTAPFWQATRNRELRYQQCKNCGTLVWHPRAHCTGCVNGDLEWQVAQGTGTIYSFSIVRQSYHPFFRHQVPYVVAYVDLDEGPRLLTNIVGVEDALKQVASGQRVEVAWESHADLNIPLFRPL